MSQQPNENIGTVDAYLRLFGGFTLLALGAGRKLGRTGTILAVLFGASKVAEGITRYCPMYDLLELTSVDGKVRRRGGYESKIRAPSSETAGHGEEQPFVERSFPWDEPPVQSVQQAESSPPISSTSVGESSFESGAESGASGESTPEVSSTEGTGGAYRRARPATKLTGERPWRATTSAVVRTLPKEE